MLTLKFAAEYLHVSTTTLSEWMAQAGMKKETLHTDRKRVYMSRPDMYRLALMHCCHLGNLNAITKRVNKYNPEDLYTMSEVARYMDLSVTTIGRWLVRYDIEKKYLETDKRAVHITFTDVLQLVLKYRYKNKRKKKKLAGIVIDQEGNSFQENPAKRDLYTLDEAARFLGVSIKTVKDWVKEAGVTKRLIYTDVKRVYLHRSDILKLADLHKKKPIEKGLYSLAEVKQLLGASLTTVRKWIEKANINKIIITTDQKRVYIHANDLRKLSDQKLEKQVDKELWTMKDASQFLGVSVRALGQWMVKANISKEVIDNGVKRVYVHHDDVLKLADLHRKS